MLEPAPTTHITSNTGVMELSALGTLAKIKEGGQGVVYDAPDVRIEGRSGFVFKEYKPAFLPKLRVAQLEAMVRLPTEAGSPMGDWLLASGAWPLATVRSSGSVVGLVMARVPNRYWLKLQKPSGQWDNELGQFVHLLNSDKWLADRKVSVSDHDRILLLRDAAKKLASLHGLDIAVGDLSPKNLLFSLSGQPRSYFIDCDAMRLHGGSVLEQAETPDWEVRSVSTEDLGTAQADVYKLGLLTVRLFARDQTTRRITDAKALPSVLGPLAQASLDSDPSSRPSAKDWAEGLRSAAEAVRPQASPPGKGGGRPRSVATGQPSQNAHRRGDGKVSASKRLSRVGGGVVRQPRVAPTAVLLVLVSIGLYWLASALGKPLPDGYKVASFVGLSLTALGWWKDRGGPCTRVGLAVGGLLGLASVPLVAALLLTKLVAAILLGLLSLAKLVLQLVGAAVFFLLLYLWIER